MWDYCLNVLRFTSININLIIALVLHFRYSQECLGKKKTNLCSMYQLLQKLMKCWADMGVPLFWYKYLKNKPDCSLLRVPQKCRNWNKLSPGFLLIDCCTPTHKTFEIVLCHLDPRRSWFCLAESQNVFLEQILKYVLSLQQSKVTLQFQS